jgi:hypothetical protein
LGDAAVADFLGDADPRLAAEAAIAIHDDLAIPAALPRLAEWLANAPETSSEAAWRRAVNANFRLGSPEAAGRVAAFALGKTGPETVRAEALSLLALWTAPPPLDRTDGRLRALGERPAEPLRATLQPRVNDLLALESPRLRVPGLELLVKLQLKAPSDRVAAVVADAKVPVPVRREALRLLAAQDAGSPELARPIDDWLAAPAKREPAVLRAEALRILGARDAARAVSAAQAILAQGEPVAVSQRTTSPRGRRPFLSCPRCRPC